MSTSSQKKALQAEINRMKNKKQGQNKQSNQKNQNGQNTFQVSEQNKGREKYLLGKVFGGVRNTISDVLETTRYNPERRAESLRKIQNSMQDTNHSFYSPYSRSTNSAVSKLRNMGFNMDNIDDKWYEQNSWLQNYLTLNDYTNSPKKPGKKASAEEKAAYEIHQLRQREDITRKAEKETSDLEKYLTEQATDKRRTKSDKEIIEGIDWSLYPTLSNMKEYAGRGAPMSLNRAVNGADEDWAYTTLWRAMNKGGSGDYFTDLVNSIGGYGKTWESEQARKQAQQKAIQTERDAYSEADMQRAEQRYLRNQEQMRQNALAENINGQDVERQRAEQQYLRGRNAYQEWINELNRNALAENINGGDVEQQRAEQQYRRWQNNLTPGHATIGEYKAQNSYIPGRQNDIFYTNLGEDLARRKGELNEQLDGLNAMVQYEEDERQKRQNWQQDYSGVDRLYNYIADWNENNEKKILNGNYAEDVKENAQTTLDNLMNNREDERERAINRVAGLLATNPELMTRQQTEEEKAELRKIVFNELMGDQNAYDKYYAAFDADEIFYLDTYIDEAIEMVTQPEAYRNDQLSAWQEKKDAAERELSTIEHQEAAIAEAERLAGQATGSGAYNREVVEGRVRPQTGENALYINRGDDIDVAVYNANNPWMDEFQRMYVENGHARDAEPDWDEVRPEYFMNDAQVRVLNQLYGDGTPEEKENARAFLDALKTYCLNQMKSDYMEERMRENARDPLGWMEGIATIPTNVVAGMIGLGATVADLFGNEAARDPNSEWYTLQKYVTNTRDERGNVWGDSLANAFGGDDERKQEQWRGIGKFLNGVAYSMADNLVAMATTAGMGKVFNYDMASKTAERMIQLVMSSEATSATMLEQLKNGMEPGEAAIMAIGGGLIEAITEKYSIENLLQPNVREMLGDGKQLLKFLGKNTLAEGAEEGASDILNLLLDGIVSGIAGHDTELVRQIKELQAANPTMTEEEAEKQVFGQWWKQLGMDIAAGALSGLVMSGGRVALNSVTQGNIGKSARTGETYKANGGDLALINSAIELPEGSQSRKLAEKIQSKLDSGKKVSNKDVGQLVQNIYNETEESIGQAAATVVEDRAFSMLEGKDLGGMDQREAAQLIAKAVSGEDLSRSERKTLTKNESLYKIYKEFVTPTETAIETAGEQAEATQKTRQIRDSVSELVGTKKAAEVNTEEAETTQMADENEIAEADQAAAEGRGKKSGTSRDVIVGGEYGQITGIKTTGEGNNRRTYFTVDVNGKTTQVDINKASEIRATDFGTAAIIRQAAVNQGLYQASANQTDNNFKQYTDILLEAQANGKTGNVGSFLANAQRVRIAAFTGQAMPVVNMDKGVAMEIYQNSALEHKANRLSTDQTGNVTYKGAGNGTARFNGAEYGTDAWNKALDSVDEITRGEMNAAAEIAKRSGIEVTFLTGEQARSRWNLKEGEDVALYYGSENRSGIAINIEGKNATFGGGYTGRHHIMVTFGHEMTHWMQRNSLKGYTQLERFVTGELVRTRGENYLNKRLGEIMEAQNLSLEDAMSELVADSCDQILADENVQKHIAETNQSLFTEIKGFVKDLVSRISNAVKGMSESQSRDARAMMNSANRLAKIWLGAYDEALSGKIAEAEADQFEGIRMSKADDAEDRQIKIQINNHLPEIMAMDSIISISTDIDLSKYNYAKDNKAKYKAWAEDLINAINGKVYREGFGEVVINATRVKTGLGYRMSNKQRAAFAAVPETIRKGLEINFHKEHKGNVDVEESHTFAAKVTIDGEPKVMAVAVVLTQGENRYKTHKVFLPNGEVWTIEKETASGSAERNESQLPRPTASENNIPQNGQDGNNRFSKVITSDDGNQLAEITESGTVSRFSLASWNSKEITKVRENLKKNGFTKEQIDKWINDVNSVAALIAADRDRLDYVADRNQRFLKPNSDVYKYSLDASTLCAKRLLYQGTFNAIQAQLPNTPLRPGDLIELSNMMREEGFQTPCGICYVESQRRKTGDFTDQFIKDYAKKHQGEFIPQVKDLTSSDGLYKLRDEHPDVYKAYIAANNKRGSGSVKPVQLRTDYRGDVRGMKKETIEYLKTVGGLRIQSFSDFETPHLIDMMQAVLDMAAVKLTSQAYTKVPNFAWVFGGTGIKINLSLMGAGTGVDENGNLIFSSVEGMDFNEAMKLRNAYSENVGTILVGMNDKHILAAMADDRIDYIIPFHSSQWTQEELDKMTSLANYEDYQDWQNERTLEGYYKNGNPIYKKTESNLEPNGPKGYWDYSKTGKENAETYLKLCAEKKIIPKFNQFLVDNGDGSFSLQPDGSTDGYWKLLIDFKMYDNNGKGAPQQAVKPNINMKEAERVLAEFDGTGVKSLPVADKVVERYVREYKEKHPNVERYSRATSMGMDVGAWMAAQTPGSLMTEDERSLLQAYKDLRIKISLSIKRQLDYKASIKRLENKMDQLTAAERDDLQALRIKLQTQEAKQEELEHELYKVTSADGYAGLMYQNNLILSDFVLGKTQDQVRESVEQMVDQVKATEKAIAQQVKALQKLAESQEVKAVASMVEKKSLNYAVNALKNETNTKMGKKELESRLIEMALRKANGEDITGDARALAEDMTNRMRGYQLDVMERMRGVTITIGPDQQAEMKGNGMTLASVREALKGTGVRVQYGDFSSLDTDTQEGGDLRTLLPELPADIGENSADALNKFISWAQSMRDADLQAKQSMVDVEDTTMNVMALVSTIKVGENTAEYQKLNQAAAATRKMAGELEQMGKDMSNRVGEAGTRAVGWASVLQRDVHTAIDYYNKVAKLAAQEEKMKVKKDLIEKLRSENTRNLIKQQMEYEERMKNDRKARDLAEDNKVLRNKITTVAKRVSTRLFNETDQKNIPEEAKPLARKMLELLTTHDYVGYRRVINYSSKMQLENIVRALDSYRKRDGDFDPDTDLNWLIVGKGEDADTEMADRAYDALMAIESGLLEYRQAEGQRHISLMDRKAALKKIDTAVTEIWSMIDARAKAEINHRKMLVEEIALQAQDDMQHSRFKGENTGIIGHGKKAVKAAVFYGNMTPEYFFKMLRNKTISQLYDEYHRAENKYGLLADKTSRKIEEIAEKYGFNTWDQKKLYTFQLAKGGKVELTLGEMMSLCATWEREAMNQAELNGPEKSFHLETGGFVTEAKEKHKINGREFFNQRPNRVTQEDISAMLSQMTDEQKSYMEEMVRYITKEIGELGNEASMRMYGIKKFNEKYYFPMKVWSGVLSSKSDAGVQQQSDNRIAHFSGSKRRRANANNALLIRDFTKVVCEHTEMQLRYNTFAPAIEFMNRTMNQQLQVETGDPEGYTKRTLEAAFQEVYGEQAHKYYKKFLEDINGGVNRADNGLYDKLLTMFKKNAVAGSMSVALQQPLSYIRAAMMIDPKYLATSVRFGPSLKKTAEEMWKYSGVAVIKKIGKFDMNYGRSTIDYMTPDAKKGKLKAGYDWLSDKSTALPELMDTWTWCNMWSAVKKEQAALHPEMDVKSDEFLNMVAERFNDVMRKTQVYDSVLVKSQNMRSKDKINKAFTSFMSEPTLTMNVLADAVGEAKAGDKGGKAKLAKAGATFILSAVLQAIVKGLVSAGRNPQDKKTWDENVAYRVGANLINELNPINLIPGYSTIMETIIKGEVSDNAMGVIGKMFESGENFMKFIRGEEGSVYRYIEDSVAQLAQLFTNIPMKNLMRDARAMYNAISQTTYAKRETSPAVLKYQLIDQALNAQNLTGAINQKVLGSQGWETNNAAYYQRIYNADKDGNESKVAGLMDYLMKARGTKEKDINEAVRGLTKTDKQLTNEEKIAKLREQGMKDSDIAQWITDMYSKKKITREEATKLYQLANPNKDADDAYFAMERKDEGVTGTSSDYFRLDEAIEKNDSAGIRKAESELLKHGYTRENIEEHKTNLYWTKDRKEYEKSTGKKVEGNSRYYRLKDAISANRSDQIKKAISQLTEHGVDAENIQSTISKEYKQKYLTAKGDAKIRLKNALIMAYKATGMEEAKAIKRIDGWKESKKK